VSVGPVYESFLIFQMSHLGSSSHTRGRNTFEGRQMFKKDHQIWKEVKIGVKYGKQAKH
jgi:hypothetical protein